jgi:hypothetical protein
VFEGRFGPICVDKLGMVILSDVVYEDLVEHALYMGPDCGFPSERQREVEQLKLVLWILTP